MDVLLFVAGAIGFGPALAVLFLLLRDYDYPRMEKALFSDTKVFGLVAAGMIIGTVVFLIEWPLYQSFYLPATEDGGLVFDYGMFFVIYVALFCLAEEGGKLMVLLFPAIRKKFDCVFYGVAIGCGMSAVAVLEMVFITIGQAGTMPDAAWFIAIVLYSIALAMMHASTGAMIAEASQRGDPWPGFFKAFALRAIVATLMLPNFITGNIWFSVPLMVLVSFLALQHVSSKVIPSALPEEIRATLRKRRGRRPKSADI
ncbi:MAG: hypothetical protein V1934_05395 [Methanobacteriota archaeon]